jgi:uncharacterized protein
VSDLNGAEPNLLIIGASTRAAAFSAKRAGYRPLCLDIFADADLQANAVVRRIENYPQGLIQALQSLPRFPLLYVGGLENQPEVLQVARERHDLLGNDADVVAAARDPAQLAESVRMAQVEMPEWRTAEEPPEKDGTWILRPLFGSGGRGIQVWNEEAASSDVLQEPHGFQKLIVGTPYSGAYIASAEPGDIRFVGVTEQLIGSKTSGAEKFQWSGNIGPTTLSIPVEHKMRRVGNILKWKLGLKGLFGVDFLVTEDERIFVTEVNPRYPASLELLEFATGQVLLNDHIQCFVEVENSSAWSPSASGPLFGKAILYAANPFTMNVDLSAEISDYNEFPAFADLPQVGTSFNAGEPVCTVFAQGATIQQCRESISSMLQQLRERLES